MLASEVTVSYTHLDVYKRQELMKANAVLESVPAIKNQKIMTISYDAVSYTHLRQVLCKI